jgi:short-subunit dehydrogenase
MKFTQQPRRHTGPVFHGRLALVTGASSGLGALFAEKLAARGMSLLLTGRDRERLENVAEHVAHTAHGAQPEIAAVDLGRPDDVAELLAAIGDRPIEVLINNAGFGTFGRFAESSPDRNLDLISVNVAAIAQLTRAVLPGMLAHGSGGILNVASTAAFQPVPRQAIYGASKAFVLSFSEALRAETRGSGVHVTALAPGPTRTGFVAALDAPTAPSSRLYRRLAAPEPVVDAGLRGLERNRSVVVPGWTNAIDIQASRLLPRNAVTWISARLADDGPGQPQQSQDNNKETNDVQSQHLWGPI